MESYTEEELTAAITSYRDSEYDSIKTCSDAFKIPKSTFYHRLHGRKSSSGMHENQQSLTSTEEPTLVKWVSRLSKCGFPMSLPLTLELAEEIRLNRHPLLFPSTILPLISRRWLDRFRQRHPILSTVYYRTIDASRIDGMNFTLVNDYFQQLKSAFDENHYPADAIYNMDQSGFSLGSTGNNKVIVSQVTRKELRKFKKIPGRQ
jgi:hypothetical protein